MTFVQREDEDYLFPVPLQWTHLLFELVERPVPLQPVPLQLPFP